MNLFRIIGNISDGKNRLAEVNNELAQTQKLKDDLEKEIKERESMTYLEKEARNRLNLIKPGERIVILPKRSTPEDVLSGDQSTATTDATTAKTKEPNWMKWKRLLFD